MNENLERLFFGGYLRQPASRYWSIPLVSCCSEAGQMVDVHSSNELSAVLDYSFRRAAAVRMRVQPDSRT
jgi:hypothetical protein